MPIDFPPDLALKEFLGATTRHTRRIEIYESDGETRWVKDKELRLKAGSVSVDYDRDERRMLDNLTLANDDGVLLNAPEEFWYDKIIKVFRGVKVNQPRRIPKVLVLSDPAGDLTLAPAFRDALEEAGFSNVTVNTLASTWEHIMNFDVIVGLGAASPVQLALLKKAYEEGKSLFVQDADAGAWIATQFATESASISMDSTVTPLATSPHPVSKGWAPFSYINPGSRRNAARNPQAEGRSGNTVPLFGRKVLGTDETGILLSGSGTAVKATNLVTNPSFETVLTGYVANGCTLTRDTTWSEDGTYSMKASAQNNTASNDSYIRIGLTDAATDTAGGLTFFQAGKTYTVTATVRLKAKLRGIENARVRRISAFWRKSSDGGSYPGLSGAQFPNEPGTYHPTLTFTVPSDADQAFFRLNVGVNQFLRTNYCNNPSFETNNTNWSVPTGVTIARVAKSTTTEPVAVGGYVGSLTFTTGVSGTSYAYSQATIPAAAAGKWLYFAINARRSTSPQYGTVEIQGKDALNGNTVVSTVVPVTFLTGSGARHIAVVQVPAGVTVNSIRAIIRCYNDEARTLGATSGVMHIDAADYGVAETQEEANEFAASYMDGAMTDDDAWDYGWAGTAHASFSTAAARQELFFDSVTAVEGSVPMQFNGGKRWTNLLPSPRDAGIAWITNGATGVQQFVSTGGPKNVGYKEFRLTTSTTSGTSLGLRTSPLAASAPKVSGGETYIFSSYYFLQPNLAAGAVPTVGIAVEWLDANNNIISESFIPVNAVKAAWTRVSNTYTSPGNAVRAQTRIIFSTTSGFNGGTLVQVSANMVEIGTELREYYEGSRSYTDNAMARSLSVAWNGAVNASQSVLVEQITSGATTPFSWVNNFARWVITKPRVTGSGAGIWYGHESGYRSPLVGNVGQRAGASLWMRSTVDASFQLTAVLYNAGVAASPLASMTINLVAGQWAEIKVRTGVATTAFDEIGWYVQSSTVMPVDTAYDITALLLEKDDAGAYFDGDMPNTTRIANQWESTANASTSLQANAATQAYTVNDPSFTPLALAQDLYVDSTSTMSLASAYEEPSRGGRAVALTIPVDFTMYDSPGVKSFLSSAFEWLDTFEPMKEWEVQIGEFMIDRITEQHFPFDITVTGRDYTKKCIKSKFLHATQFGAGMPLEHLIDSIAGAAGVVKRSLPTTGVVVDREFFFDRGVTRWEALKEIATAYNHEIFFDATGYLTVRPFRDPTTESPLVTVKTGIQGNLASYEKSTSDTEIYNLILVTGESSDSETLPVWAVAENHNTESPTAIEKIGERVYEYSSSFITTEAQAQALANSYLAIYALEENELSFEVLMMPWLEVGDILGFEDPRPAPGDPTNFLLTNLSIPLALGPMSGTGRRVMIVG